MARLPLPLSQTLKLLAAILLVATAHGATSAAGASLDELLAQGDAADARHKNREALAFYEQAAALSHDNPAILRRVAKQKAQLLLETSDHAEKRRLAAEAVLHARRAVELAPGDSENQLTLAIVLGRAAFLESPRQKIASARDIRDAAEKATRLDPSNDLAWHVLGRWHYEMATLNPVLRAAATALFGRLPDASLEKASEYFERAIRTGPPRVMHFIEYGRALAALNRPGEAAAQIRKGLALPNSDKDDNETKRRGRETLRRLRLDSPT